MWTRRLILGAALASACTTSSQALKVSGVSALVAVGGGLVMATAPEQEGHNLTGLNGQDQLGLVMIVTGGIVAISSFIAAMSLPANEPTAP